MNEMINNLQTIPITTKKNNNNGRWSRWISHSPEVKRNICLFWSSVQRWGYKPSVECPFKLFTAQSGVFFSSDLKMGIGGHPFFPAGSPSPLFLLVRTPSSSSSSLCLLLKRCSGRTLGNKKWSKVQPRTPLDLYVMHRHAHTVSTHSFRCFHLPEYWQSAGILHLRWRLTARCGDHVVSFGFNVTVK